MTASTERAFHKEQGVALTSPAREPSRSEIAAAKLIMKRHREGRGNVKITPTIEYLASFERTVPSTPAAVSQVRKPTRGEIAAAKLIMKRHREGRGNVKITPTIEYLASLG